jgi:hypothetical protein
MVLLVAVIIGLTAGLIRAAIGKREYRAYELKQPIFVVLAFIPQLVCFFLPFTRTAISDRLASIFFICSLIILFVFSLLNIRKISFWPITFGFFLNALVILVNGGWMPITPEAVLKLNPNAPAGSWTVGERLGYGKDIVLSQAGTRLWALSDRFTLPNWMTYQVAFSVGDVLIAIGVIWLLWSLGGKTEKVSKEN